jgi:hypothetical protein
MKNIIFKKKVLLMILLFSVSFAANKATKPYTFTSGTAARSSEVNKNYDSVYVPFNKLVDTVNLNVPRSSSLADTFFTRTINISGLSKADTQAVRSITASYTIKSDSTTTRALKYTGNATGGNSIPDSLNCHGTVIQKNGYLGIGTIIPASKFQVKAGTDRNFAVSGSTNLTGITCQSYNDIANAFEPFEFAASSYLFNIGKVGIGSSSPTEALTVKGNISDTGNLTAGGVISDSIKIKNLYVKIGCGGTVATQFQLPGTATPSSTIDTAGVGNYVGSFCHDANYIYFFIPTIGWKRAALSTW